MVMKKTTLENTSSSHKHSHRQRLNSHAKNATLGEAHASLNSIILNAEPPLVGHTRPHRQILNRPQNDTGDNIIPRLTSSQRNDAIGRLQAGYLRMMWQGTLASPDRPSLFYFRNQTTTATTTATQIPRLRRISDQRVCNRLREWGISPRRPVRRNILISRHLGVTFACVHVSGVFLEILFRTCIE